MSYDRGYADGWSAAWKEAEELTAKQERELTEAREEIDALVRTKLELTEVVEQLERDINSLRGSKDE